MKNSSASALPRLDRPEFAHLMNTVEKEFGALRKITQFTVVSEGDVRVRMMLARSTGKAGNLCFSAGKRDFSYLAFSVEGREEVWIVPRHGVDFPEDGVMTVRDVNHPDGIEAACLTAPGYKLSLAPYLQYPTKEMLQTGWHPAPPVKLSSEADNRRALARVKYEEERATAAIAFVERCRSEGWARRKSDSDFAGLIEKVEASIGQLTPVNDYSWRLKNGEVARFSLSKPARGTNDRAFVCFSPTSLESNWIAVGVRGCEVSWLIPTGVLREFLRNKRPIQHTSKYTVYFGYRDDQDCIWINSEGDDAILSIEQFKLYSVFPSRITSVSKKIEREKESARLKAERAVAVAAARNAKTRASLANDFANGPIFSFLEERFGKLDFMAAAPVFTCKTGNGEVVKFGALSHRAGYPTRAKFIMTKFWYKADWVAFSIKGQSGGWLVPMAKIKALLSRFAPILKDGEEAWSLSFGPRGAVDRLWISSHYRSGNIDISEFWFDFTTEYRAAA